MGLSCALIPLLLYGWTLAGWQQNALVVRLIALISLAICSGTLLLNRPRLVDGKSALLLGTILAFTLTARLWATRDLAFPLWTDSYHHVLIAQIIADTGQIPQTYDPYAPIQHFTYHFGFHALTAWLHWGAGLPIPRATVVMGQMLNALSVLTVFVFTRRLFGGIGAGICAAFITGLLSHMPAQYVNWGRYTQLSGLVLLPVTLTLFVDTVQALLPPTEISTSSEASSTSIRVGRRLTAAVLTAISMAGLFFLHYRIFLFAGLFCAIYLVYALWQWWHAQRDLYLLMLPLVLALGSGLATVLLLLPWIQHLLAGFGARVVEEVTSDYQPDVYGAYLTFQIREFGDFGMYQTFWLLAGVGTMIGIARRNGLVACLLVWLGGLLLLANLHLIGIPPLYATTIVIISLYFPVAALAGYGVTELAHLLYRWGGTTLRRRLTIERRDLLGTLLALLCIGAVGVWSIQFNRTLVARDNAFIRPADLQAMEWIRENVSRDALFYVRMQIWTPTVAHGLDAGYWLPFLTLRQTIMPPEIYASDGTIEYMKLINTRTHVLLATTDASQLWEKLLAYGITHVYLGQRQAEPPVDLFLSCPACFEILYERDGVFIFRVHPAGNNTR